MAAQIMARCIQHTLGPVFSNRLHADGFRGFGPVVIPNLVLFFTLLSHPILMGAVSQSHLEISRSLCYFAQQSFFLVERHPGRRNVLPNSDPSLGTDHGSKLCMVWLGGIGGIESNNLEMSLMLRSL